MAYEGGEKMGIGEMTIGNTSSGVQKYLDDLKLATIDDVVNKIENYSEVEDSLNLCWQGHSRDRFFEDFMENIEKIKEELQKEYNNMSNKVWDLTGQMHDFDAQDVYEKN